MSKLTNASGDNWNVCVTGEDISLSVNCMTVTIKKSDIDVITMVLQQMK